MPTITKQSHKAAHTLNTSNKNGSVLSRIGPMEFSEYMKVLVYGQSGCLSGDTFINYQIETPDGRKQNGKGGPLELLYKRFNDIPRKGKGYYQRKQTLGSDYYVYSITDDGRIIKNLVTDVIDSGNRQVLEVCTESGKVLKATANHEFMTEEGYQPLGSLSVGQEVLVSAGKRIKDGQPKKRARRLPEVLVKNHAAGRRKMVDKYEYFRVSHAHFIYEAAMNSLTPEEYKEALNLLSAEQVKELWTVPEGCEVRHLDENPMNDSIDNLELASSSSEHQRLYHATVLRERPNMNVMVVADRITSITKLGTERVYDISVADPYHNFIASGFAVHNSGKTTFASSFPGPMLWVVASGGQRSGELLSVNTQENRKKISQVNLHASSELREIIDHVKDVGRYQTLVLDHATGLQDLILKEILGIEELPAQKSWGMAQQQQYGECSLRCKESFRALLNLPMNVVIIAQERTFGDDNNSDIIKPTVGAALTPSVTGWLNPACDFVLQTYKRPRMEQTVTKVAGKEVVMTKRGKGVEYCLRTEAHEVFQTKFRIPKGVPLPECIVDADYDKLLQVINGTYETE